MPIPLQFRLLPPLHWRQLSASIRFRRAQGRCERVAGHKGRP